MQNVIRDVRMPKRVRKESETMEGEEEEEASGEGKGFFRYGYIRSKEDRAGWGLSEKIFPGGGEDVKTEK